MGILLGYPISKLLGASLMARNVTAYYDATANRYDDLHGHDPEHIRALELHWPSIKRLEPRSVLDVGCGTGRTLRWFSAKAPDIDLFGIDPSGGCWRRPRPHFLARVWRSVMARISVFQMLHSTSSAPARSCTTSAIQPRLSLKCSVSPKRGFLSATTTTSLLGERWLSASGCCFIA